ncbi:MAG: hypothetical protein ABEJ94_05965 [Halorientalis sp.]
MYWLAALSLASALGVVAAAAVGRGRAIVAARTAAVTVTLPSLVGIASAGAVDRVGTIACRLGVGDLVTFAIAALAAFHIVAGALQATVAFDALGSPRADRRRQGRRAVVGAFRVTAGAVFPIFVGALFTVVLDFELGACIHLV